MTTCLLCTYPAVADGLCVADGARLWAAMLWRDDRGGAITLQADIIAAGVVHPDHIHRAKALVESVPTLAAATTFLAHLDAARRERDAKTCGRPGCRKCLEER